MESELSEGSLLSPPSQTDNWLSLLTDDRYTSSPSETATVVEESVEERESVQVEELDVTPRKKARLSTLKRQIPSKKKAEQFAGTISVAFEKMNKWMTQPREEVPECHNLNFSFGRTIALMLEGMPLEEQQQKRKKIMQFLAE